MAIAPTTDPITADDTFIQRALDEAFLPALLPALAQATGDISILRDDLRPGGVGLGVVQGGMTEAQQRDARLLALQAIKVLRDRPGNVDTQLAEDDVQRITGWMTGSKATGEYLPYLMEELAPFGQDPRAPRWKKDHRVPFAVAIIGAGMSGILAAIRLKQAGIPFVIIEKNPDFGGTWLENTYPGARVDVSNAFYSYSFAQKLDWPKHYSTQDVLLEYFRNCAAGHDLRQYARFNTEAESIAFNDESRSWTLTMRSPAGESFIEVQAVISAVGQLNRPKMPEIPGMDTFAGPQFHSARWNHRVDLTGKRVAVIGSGASAAQFIPVVAKQAAELTIFQRTPNWFVPVPNYHDDVSEGLSWLYTHIPHYMHWYRFWLFWTTTDGMLPAARVDPQWTPQDRSVSAENDKVREIFTSYIEEQFADRPDLLCKVLPHYPPASKRLILDNGIWAETLKRDNVDLRTEPIREITANGVVTEDGTEFPADVVIYGTGFQASRFLTPMKVTGRDGIDLNTQWEGNARAYMGITIPNFPNLFLMYGPNTNIVVNGSIIYFSECEMQYILGCIKLLLESDKKAMVCKQSVHDAYNERIDAANMQRVWGVSKVNSWYKNEFGRSAQNWPFNLIEYWQQTRHPNPKDYVFV